MEPSQVVAAADEFSGIDSGWTRYIGSPLHYEIYNDDEKSVDMEEYGSNNHGNHDNDSVKNDTDGDSDDSMASDASFGPSKLDFSCVKNETSEGAYQLKHADDGNRKLLSGKKSGKQVTKITFDRMFEEEDEEINIAASKKDSMLNADSAGSHV